MPMVSRGDAWLDLLLILMIGLLLPFGSQLALALVATGVSIFPTPMMLTVSKAFEALTVLVIALYLLRRHGIPAAALGCQPRGFGRELLAALSAIFLIYVAFFLSIVIVAAIVLTSPETTDDLKQRVEFMQALPLGDVLGTVLLMIPVAIHEEVLFRGLMIPYFRRVGCNWIVAVVVSTAIFAVLHAAQGSLGIIQVFFIGAALGAAFVITRSLLAVIIAHCVFNVVQILLAGMLLPQLEELFEQQL
jgi:membrane protease YdiL (CAAX protease family)